MTTLQTQPYQTPPGKIDFPFTYVFDGTGLTDTNNYLDIQVPTQGDSDFILRHIAGVPLVATKFNFKDASRQYAIGATSTGVVFPNNWPVLPEKLYAFNRAIYLDLFNVLRNNTACGGTPIYNSYIGFFGVKRFAKSSIDLYDTRYDYRVLPQSYSFNLTLNTAHYSSGTATNPPLRFFQNMDRYDFQLLSIEIAQSGQTAPLLTNDFQITLFDSKQHALSNLPLNQGWFNFARQSPSLAPPYQAVWPTPPIVYPGGSTIIFDITSMLCSTSLPQSYNIVFTGLWRIPV
jgi:hypothetical protein